MIGNRDYCRCALNLYAAIEMAEEEIGMSRLFSIFVTLAALIVGIPGQVTLGSDGSGPVVFEDEHGLP